MKTRKLGRHRKSGYWCLTEAREDKGIFVNGLEKEALQTHIKTHPVNMTNFVTGEVYSIGCRFSLFYYRNRYIPGDNRAWVRVYTPGAQ